MSQAIPANIDPGAIGGTALSTILNDFKDAIASGFSGTVRPPNLQAGGYWVDTTNEDTPNFYWQVKIYTGSDDVEIFRVNISTGLPTISGTADVFTIARTSDDDVGPIVRMVKNRIADDGQVLQDDIIGEIRFIGLADDASEPVVAYMKVVATEDQTATEAGGYLSLFVIPTDTVTAVEAIRFGDEIESKIRHKLNSISLGSQDIATTATIAQLSAETTLVEMTGSTATDIQGINSGQDTKVITIHNRSSANVTLKHLDSGAAAADQLQLPNAKDIILVTDDSADLFYCDTDAVWKIKSGAVKPTDSIVNAQTSAKTHTIDWSAGLTQRLILADDVVISFSNPVEGAVHTLMLTQQYGGDRTCTFNMPDQDSRHEPQQPTTPISSDDTAIYQWQYMSGFKAAQTTGESQTAYIPFTDPATLITGMDLSPDGKTLSVGQTSSPYCASWDIHYSGRNYKSPFGLKNAVTPAALAAQAVGMSYDPGGKFLITACGTSPYIQGWLLRGGIPTTVMSNPTGLPAGAGKCIGMNPSGNVVGIGHTTTPYMSIYTNPNSPGWGKLANPVTLPVAQVNGLAFSPQGDYLTAVSQTTPFIQTWAFSAGWVIGSVSSNPGILPAGGPAGGLGRAVAWRPQGDFIAMAMTTTPYIYVVPFNRTTGAYGTALTVTNVPAGACASIAWSPCGQFLIVGCVASPYLYIYDFTSSLLNTNVTLGGPGLPATVNELVVHPNGEIVFVGLDTGGASYLYYFLLPSVEKNYVRILPGK